MFTARKHMAVIDYDANMDRQILKGDDGNDRCVSVYSRAQSRFVLRPQRQAKTFSYVAELLTAMLERRRAVDVATPDRCQRVTRGSFTLTLTAALAQHQRRYGSSRCSERHTGASREWPAHLWHG
ncbi:uncharacterized protein LOC122378014 [Amphibalanus amphitrite]|uniref:uncharacterized protein LOC122378014 n=1 Tax=Amphibalanus amphitrite TaxID=1232801 RepID=UPI001C9272DC|nr:uncharacterized protein LOC122378014 [Amphibalanus amphitrite]